MANKLRKIVVGAFTNISFEIRRVKMGDYLREMKDLPFSLAPGTMADLDKLKDAVESLPREKQDEANSRACELFLSKGIVRLKYPDEEAFRAPNIWFGAESECPEDHVTLADLGTDADLVAGEIAAYSFDLVGVKALQGFFRQEQQSALGPSGEEIRSEAVEPAAE